MMRSMFAGVSGLKTHQVRMDVIGNNIANVNTAGYKASRATFQEMLTQTMRGASAPTDARGGTNPLQVGLGVQLGSIDVRHTQGNTQSTGYVTDLAIEGDGFFILGQGENRVYTRAGIFGLDSGTEGNLVSLVNGMRVLGYKADREGKIDPNSPLEPLYISASETVSPRATEDVYFSGNLDLRLRPGERRDRTVQVYDSRGREHTVVVGLTHQGDNLWSWDAHWQIVSNTIPLARAGSLEPNVEYSVVENGGYELQGADGTAVATSTDGVKWQVADTGYEFEFVGKLNNNEQVKVTLEQGMLLLTVQRKLDQEGIISFNEDGSYSDVDSNEITFSPANAQDLKIELDFTQFTQYADTFTGKFLSQNGYTSGALESFTIDQNGVIVGSFSNGLTRNLGQVALAKFANPGGLVRTGSTMFAETANSGTAQIGSPGVPGYGQIAPSSLEMSNVDLSEEFTEMIITQRGFQANSRIITTSDEMLQELVNLKR
ncbi:MAG: flagellar hook protein FlgE [Bacillota bacterium]|nr:flagellar hook protein FlgE [Bacillota bacterium]